MIENGTENGTLVITIPDYKIACIGIREWNEFIDFMNKSITYTVDHHVDYNIDLGVIDGYRFFLKQDQYEKILKYLRDKVGFAERLRLIENVCR